MTAPQLVRDDFIEAHRESMAAPGLGTQDFAVGRAEDMAARKRARCLDRTGTARAGREGHRDSGRDDPQRARRDETLPPSAAAGSQRATFIPSAQAQLRSAPTMFYALGSRGWKPQTASQMGLTA